MKDTIVYQPCVLPSMQKICEVLGVSRQRVRNWIQAGAPIAVEGDGNRALYSAELAELQAWRKNRFRGQAGLDLEGDSD